MRNKEFKITVEEVQEFMETQRLLYARSPKKAFYINSHAAPKSKRYTVVVDGIETDFIDMTEAVQFFNQAAGA